MIEKKNSLVRVRFAPSPTGHLHVGGLRSAYFNWLFARHNEGTFLIRIEDTDALRSKPEFLKSQLESLEWCGIVSDEPLVIQSERQLEYQQRAQQLIDQGKAYRCYCSPEELEQRLGPNAAQSGGYTHYDGHCRNLKITYDYKPYAVRFILPLDCYEVVVQDLIRGAITFTRDVLDDFIILRSDGNPMYNFSVVIDDAYMRISHVIRGEEHLVNTPRQVLLYQAFNYTLPHFAHVPLILGSDGTKLSKRDAAVSVIEYKHEGYLPEALCNYLIRLGWSHGDQEIFTREQLIKLFSLEEVGKKGAIFDKAKLTWMNGVFMRTYSACDLAAFIARDISSSWRSTIPWSEGVLHGLIELYKERTHTLLELTQVLTHLAKAPHDYRCEALQLPQNFGEYFVRYIQELEALNEWTRATIEFTVKSVCAQYALKLPSLAQPTRCALTGTLTSPSIYDLMVLLGKDEVLKRLNNFERFSKGV